MKLLNEIKRMQHLAGLIKENEEVEFEEEENIADFLNRNINIVKDMFPGFDFTFEPHNIPFKGTNIEIASAGEDDEYGIDISFDPDYMELADDYNHIYRTIIDGKTVYINDYLRDEDGDEDEYDEDEEINIDDLD